MDPSFLFANPFFVAACLALILAKGIELFEFLRIYLVNFHWPSVLAFIPDYVLGNGTQEPKAWQKFQEEMRMDLNTLLHSENYSDDQMHMILTHIHSKHAEVAKDDIKRLVSILQSRIRLSNQPMYEILANCYKAYKPSLFQQILKRILLIAFLWGLGLLLCNAIQFRLFNAFGVYMHPTQDYMLTAVVIALISYFWNAGILLLAKAKERFKARKGILA